MCIPHGATGSKSNGFVKKERPMKSVKRVSQDDKNFIKNGVKWLNEESNSLYKKNYAQLSSSKRQAVLTQVARMQRGDSFLYTILGYIMEATLGDPIYGANKMRLAGNGWRLQVACRDQKRLIYNV